MPSPRTPIVGGNWKMNTDRASARALAQAVARGALAAARAGQVNAVDVILLPPFPYLLEVRDAIAAGQGDAALGGPGPTRLGGQDSYHAEKGAFTGEVSPLMLRDCGCSTVLAGHSERRHVLHEGDDMVNQKLRAALAAGLDVILCVGEKLEQRQTGQTDTVTERQVERGLREVTPAQLARVSIAYEPVWAIGTGQVASPDDAQNAHAHIRQVIASLFDRPAADALRIIYGGSMNAANAPGLLAMPDVDGGLIGGAALKADDFLGIVAAAAQRARR